MIKFYTLVILASEPSTTLGSQWNQQRDVRSYSQLGPARRARNLFGRQMPKGSQVKILRTSVYVDGTVETEWID